MYKLLGLAFIALLGAALTLSVLSYRKAFTPVSWVTVHADHTGLQVLPGAEVKLRGVVVGEVRQITADGRQATLRLALQPDSLREMPADVTARLLPKTLFGERYVALQVPPNPGSTRLRPGAVIGQDRTSSAVELERVLDDALPLLRAIAPDKLAATLGALAGALQGRGARLGQDLTQLDSYLAALNTQLPAIRADIRKLGSVLSTYDGALPDLLTILGNVTVTATTVSDQRDELAAFLADTTDLADSSRVFLHRYGDRIIQLGSVAAPVLSLLATYAPEYPCLLGGLVALQPQVEKVFAGGRMHITLEITRDNGRYVPGRDDPLYAARGGPDCRGLPRPAVPAPQVATPDGYDYGASRPALDPLPLTVAPMGYAGTPEEQALVKPLVAGVTGTDPAQVPDVADLLWGPLLRGTVVNAS
ncbi:MAG: phospholipid/cholesterol/gamma-HCH transport system substrate-binding protein [Micromonosporaceae bacterium]